MPRPKRNPEPCNADNCHQNIRYWSTGFCNKHHQQSLRSHIVLGTCEYDGCDKALSTNNKVGRCGTHRYEVKTWGTCGADSCGRRIRSDNKSGLCATCIRVQKCAEWQHERRAKTASLWVEYVDREQVLSDHGGTCHLCAKAVGADWQVDHVIPIAIGGPHCYDNVAPSHPTCNRRKSWHTVGSPDPTVDAAARRAFEQFHGQPL